MIFLKWDSKIIGHTSTCFFAPFFFTYFKRGCIQNYLQHYKLLVHNTVQVELEITLRARGEIFLYPLNHNIIYSYEDRNGHTVCDIIRINEVLMSFIKIKSIPAFPLQAIETLKGFEKKDSKVQSTAATNLSFLYFLVSLISAIKVTVVIVGKFFFM